MKNPLLLLTAMLCSLLASCASGPDYSSVKASGALSPHKGKGMVLIYRSSGFVSAAYKPVIYINNVEQSARLARGGFMSYEASPGPLHLAHSKVAGDSTSETRTKAVVGNAVVGAIVLGPVGAALGGSMAVSGDIDAHRKVGLDIVVRPNETHYVVMGGAGGPLESVPKEEGEEDIVDCHWLNPSSR